MSPALTALEKMLARLPDGTQVVGYTVRNAGNDAASTWLAESVRLVDVNDATRIVNLATPSASRTLAPGAGYSHSLNITVPAVPAGQWRLEVQADAWGYDSLWNFDHFYPIVGDSSAITSST